MLNVECSMFGVLLYKKTGRRIEIHRPVAFSVPQEQPRLSPQFKHLKQAPLRTATWPQFGHVGASCWKCAMESLRDFTGRPVPGAGWPLPLPGSFISRSEE